MIDFSFSWIYENEPRTQSTNGHISSSSRDDAAEIFSRNSYIFEISFATWLHHTHSYATLVNSRCWSLLAQFTEAVWSRKLW